jgi:hypothetical protein
MQQDFELKNLSIRDSHLSIWGVWSDTGPAAKEFSVLILLPDDRVAMVPVTENGFEVERATYLRSGHPLYFTCPAEEPVLIPYCEEDNTQKSVELDSQAWICQLLNRKKSGLQTGARGD